VNEFLRQAAPNGNSFGLIEVFVTLGLSSVLLLLLAYFYRQSHRGLSYSASFVHAMVLLGITVSMIMLVIGSNIARAFTLVGALSIIRFRNPVKDSRDVAFIFIAMAIGMSVGTGFYFPAVVFTLFASFMAYALARFEIGASSRREQLLKLMVPSTLAYDTAFNELFYRSLREHALLSVETMRDGSTTELVFSVELKSGVSDATFLSDLRAITGGGKATLLTGQGNIDL